MDDRAILEFLKDVARFAGAGEARKPGAARAYPPGGNGYRKLGDGACHALDIEAATSERRAQRLVVLMKRFALFRVLCVDELRIARIGGNAHQSPLNFLFSPLA